MSILECTALSKNYGRVQALQNVDLSLDSGRIVGLVGPNGSGKTTRSSPIFRTAIFFRPG